MTTAQRPAPADVGRVQGDDGAEQTLLVLGATGDLTGRLLLPGLGGLLASGTGPDLFVLGSGMEDWDDERWRRRVRESFAAVDGDRVAATVRQTRYLRADVTREDDLRRLFAQRRPRRRSHSLGARRHG